MLRRVLKALLFALAVVYFLIDLLFLSILRPLRRRLIALRLMQRLRLWVGTLHRYAALALFVVPWLLLEPVKPTAFYLFAHHHHTAASVLIVAGEIVKLTLVERLFDMTRPQLMTFGWFAWGYGHWRAALDYLRALPVWRGLAARYRAIRLRVMQLLRPAR